MNTMIKNRLIRFKYKVKDHEYEVMFNKNFENEHFHFIQTICNEANLTELKLELIPHTEICLLGLNIEMKVDYKPTDLIYVNGYQSWTDSKEFFIDEKMKRLSKLAKPLLNHYQFDKYGDYNFKSYAKHKGDFHGYTYGYIRNEKELKFIGSLSERNGYTILNTSVRNHSLVIEKECKEHIINTPYEAFNLVFIEGEESYVFDKYFEKMEINKPKVQSMTGWTSWYNYYQNINEEIILKNLNVLKQSNKNIDIVQIDDGYQCYVGDWLDIDQVKFPHGMKYLADKIHKQGYKAGIWLAPFVCETNSRLFKEKPEWILKDKKGDFVLAGSNWSRFYALDLECEEVKKYIKNVFSVVLNDWGYDLVKLDFLYAACIIPTQNKTRGQIMCEGMEFLRGCVKDKLILGCGVPLGPSFGQVDYCRIGCDVGLDWDDKAYMRLLHRERVSTLNAVTNSISRRHLDGRAFLNDPDVFFLREDNLILTDTQKYTVAIINKLFGSLIFTSDDISYYNKSQHLLMDEVMSKDLINIIDVQVKRNGMIEVEYMRNQSKYTAYINLSSKSIQEYNPFETKIIQR